MFLLGLSKLATPITFFDKFENIFIHAPQISKILVRNTGMIDGLKTGMCTCRN